MNENHRQLCASEGWGDYIRDELLPWVLGDRDLGADVLEIGPGPGLTTDLLRARTERLTAIEVDADAAAALARRLAGSNVSVLRADGTDMPFAPGRFSCGLAMTMLHHVPTAAGQDVLLAEACRVLEPGAWLMGVDAVDDEGFREFHVDDVCVPVDPGTLEPRLREAGFASIQVEERDGAFRFAARRP
jgi:SAM-dependent methyltransferase